LLNADLQSLQYDWYPFFDALHLLNSDSGLTTPHLLHCFIDEALISYLVGSW